MPLVNADAILERMRADTDSDWPDRLLSAMSDRPLVGVKDVTMEHRAPADLGDTALQVLRLHSYGLSDQMTADALGISFDTVRQHLKASRYRLRAKNTTHACCLAIRQGLIA